MKIAIHDRKDSSSEGWIEYCRSHDIDYKIVDAFDNNIIEQVEDCNIFMWHYHHNDFKDMFVARKVLFALEHAGIKVFPNFKTSWHFDDKVAQKYLLEALEIPMVKSYVFYDKKQAIDWALNTSYPKVFKLKGGAGASNVSLVRSSKDAIKKINTSFGKGFEQYNRFNNLDDRVRKLKNGEGSVFQVVKGIGRLFITPEYSKQLPPERGYAYFQDFIPDNDSDTRVVVIKDKAFAINRLVRSNDFRASGSGKFIFDHSKINIDAVKIAFDTNAKLDSQSTAFDFVYDTDNNPLIVEISFGTDFRAYIDCPGYWDSNLNWYQGQISPQAWMVENMIKELT